MNSLREKAVLVKDRLLDSEEHAGEAAVPVVAQEAAAIIAGLLAALQDIERIARADENERCARIAEGVERSAERHWVPGSLYGLLRRETAAEIRKTDSHPSRSATNGVPCSQGGQESEDTGATDGLFKYTVVAIEDSGFVPFLHVWAKDGQNAFASAVACRTDIEVVAAVPGWQEDGKGIYSAGEGAVDAETVREQVDVFGEPAFLATADHFKAVMRRLNASGKLDVDEKGIDGIADDLHERYGAGVVAAAMTAHFPDNFGMLAEGAITKILVEHGHVRK